jgi:fructose-bisphosphate aldolase, class II
MRTRRRIRRVALGKKSIGSLCRAKLKCYLCSGKLGSTHCAGNQPQEKAFSACGKEGTGVASGGFDATVTVKRQQNRFIKQTKIMVNYKELGLVNTRDMFARAIKGGYAVPAFNFNNLEQLQAIIKASSELKSPVILQVSKGARNYANETLLRYMAEGAVEYAKELGCKHPEIVLHLDHGDSFELCKSCVDLGFSSVMIDGSALPYEENIALTKKVVDYAHQYDVTVEGELGVLAGVEDEVASEVSHYTKPEEVIDFTSRTGVDSLAISIGTSHGAYKFKPEQCTRDPKTGRLVPPPLAFDVLDEIMEKLPGFPIVLHGSSSVPQEYVDIINANGGKLPDAVGIPEEQLRKASKSAVCKINIDSDSRLAFTAAVRKVFAEKPAEFDPRKYCGPARDLMEQMYKHKITEVLGSDNKLAQLD